MLFKLELFTETLLQINRRAFTDALTLLSIAFLQTISASFVRSFSLHFILTAEDRAISDF